MFLLWRNGCLGVWEVSVGVWLVFDVVRVQCVTCTWVGNRSLRVLMVLIGRAGLRSYSEKKIIYVYVGPGSHTQQTPQSHPVPLVASNHSATVSKSLIFELDTF